MTKPQLFSPKPAPRGAKADRALTVVLADDHPTTLEGVAAVLERDPSIRVVGKAADGEEAIRLVETHRPTVAILDILMGALSGVRAAQRIHARVPETLIIILSQHVSGPHVAAAQRAGVKGYLDKHSASEFLPEAVRTVAKGGVFYSPSVARLLNNDHGRICVLEGKTVEFTDSEVALFEPLVKGWSYREIGDRLRISHRAVESRVGWILLKAGRANRKQLVDLIVSEKWFDPATDQNMLMLDGDAAITWNDE